MAQPGPITTVSVRPDLPSQSMSSTTGTYHACGGSGVVPPSSVKITWMSKQYQVSGQSGTCLLTGDWDGELEGVLPDASISLALFWPLGGMRVWPSVWMVAPDFWSSRSLDWVAISAEMLTISWNYQISLFNLGAKAYSKKLRNERACASCV